MSGVRGIDTTPKIALRRALGALGICGWRVHARDLPGKPDAHPLIAAPSNYETRRVDPLRSPSFVREYVF